MFMLDRVRKNMIFDQARACLSILEKVEYKTVAHSTRIVEMSCLLGEWCGLGRGELDTLKMVSYFHDVGIADIPAYVRKKAGILTDDERDILNTHSVKSQHAVGRWLNEPPVLAGIRYHHECWDGSGYPDGLNKVDIPVYSRILTVVDVYDALISPRSYRTALSHTAALERMMSLEGVKFDPRILSVFLELDSIDPSYFKMEK